MRSVHQITILSSVCSLPSTSLPPPIYYPPYSTPLSSLLPPPSSILPPLSSLSRFLTPPFSSLTDHCQTSFIPLLSAKLTLLQYTDTWVCTQKERMRRERRAGRRAGRRGGEERRKEGKRVKPPKLHLDYFDWCINEWPSLPQIPAWEWIQVDITNECKRSAVRQLGHITIRSWEWMSVGPHNV